MKWLQITSFISHHPISKSPLSLPLTRRQYNVLSSPPNPQTLTALCKNGEISESLLIMAILGSAMEFETYNAILNACLTRKAIREGQRVHAHMIKTHYRPPTYLRNRLVIFYNKCELLKDARQLFDQIPQPNVVSWTAMISAYSQRGFFSQALTLFSKMLRSGICKGGFKNLEFCGFHFIFSEGTETSIAKMQIQSCPMSLLLHL